MKKLFLISLALLLCFSVASCSGGETESSDMASSTAEGQTSSPAEAVNLVDVVTEQKVNLKLPDTLEKQESNFYADTETGDSVTFTAGIADPSFPLSDWSQEEFAGFQFSEYQNLVITSFDNDITLNGNNALICKFSFTSDAGSEIEGTIVYLVYSGAEFSVSFLYSSDNENSALKNSLQECIDSITVVYD